jgi:RNA polymerase sigma factor (sigma-70 family)
LAVSDRWNSLIHTLRRLSEAGAAPSSDRELLRRFAADGDHGAFAELVRRHSGPVYAVCWRELKHAHDAEDAFQATFMVLARKADRADWTDSLGKWLQEVAYRTACHVRRQRSRRGRRQDRLLDDPAEDGSSPADAADVAEAARAADEEVKGLPERYRAPLVACYWDGLTQEQAAERLGWSYRTFKRRLADGRELLRARLSHRGVCLSAGVGGAVTAEAVVPGGLAAATAAAAARFAARSGAAGGWSRAELAALACGTGAVGPAVKVAALVAVAVGATAGAVGMVGAARPVAEASAPTRPVPLPAADFKPLLPHHTDIGSPFRPGSVRFANGRYEIAGGGTDIWGTADTFHFAYAPADGDRALVCRVLGVMPTHPWAKSGLMFRAGLEPGAAFVGLYASPGFGVALQWRDAAGANAGWTGASEPAAAPVWLRLSRRGDTFDAEYAKTDGRPGDGDWVPVAGGRHVARMPAGVLAGLAVCSHEEGQLAASGFDGVALDRPGPAAPGRELFAPSPVPAFDPGGRPDVDYSAGFAERGLALGGFGAAPPVVGRALRLTDGTGWQTRTAYSTTRVGVGAFVSRFRFRWSRYTAEDAGLTFRVQDREPTAGGPRRSLAVTLGRQDTPERSLWVTAAGADGAGVEPAGVVFGQCGRPVPGTAGPLDVEVRSDGRDVWVTVSEAADPSRSEAYRFPLRVREAVGADAGYVGFDGWTTDGAFVQDLLAWTYTAGPGKADGGP